MLKLRCSLIQAGWRKPAAPEDHQGIQRAGIGYFFTLIESFAEPMKNGSQAANQMFSAFPEMTLTVCHES
jgi:hypothetical protein